MSCKALAPGLAGFPYEPCKISPKILMPTLQDFDEKSCKGLQVTKSCRKYCARFLQDILQDHARKHPKSLQDARFLQNPCESCKKSAR